MPTFKVTILFQLATNVSDPSNPARRVGGWTESFYSIADSSADVIAPMQSSLCPLRAALLPTGGSIVGQRIQQIDPVGRSQSLNRVFPGTAGIQADVPQMALLCKVPALGFNNIRPMILRGIPDARVVEGEYSPTIAFATALQTFFTALQIWRFRAVATNPPPTPLLEISTAGVVLTAVPHVFVVNDMIQVKRAVGLFGQLRGGRYRVISVGPGNNQLSILGWQHGECVLGTAIGFLIFYPSIDNANITIGRIITRRVGRPFTQYVGRRSRKRG